MDTVSINRAIRFLSLGVNISRKRTHTSQFHFCAILAKRNSIRAMGFNMMRTHPKSTTKYRTLHAEQDAVIGTRTRGCTLYVARTGGPNRGSVLLSKPCPGCAIAIFAASIKEVFYTISNTEFGYWNVREDTNQIFQTSRVLGEDV